MKLVKHLAPIPPPFGGVTIYVKRLTQKLNDDGYASGAYYNKIMDPSLDLNNYTFNKGLSRKRFLRSFLNLVKETREYSIIHSHNVFDDVAYLWLLALLKKKKIVITVHNDRAVSNYHKQPFIFRFFLQLLAKRSPKWITVSPQGKQELLKLPIKFKDITVLPAFIPTNDIDNSLITTLSPNLISFVNSYDKIIVFYAYKTLVDNKDLYGSIETLMMFSELVKNTSKCGLVFCMSDIDSDLSFLEQLALKNDIYDKIFWQIGPIEDMYELWSISHLYVRPTMKDGDSISIREALQMNLKVVASDVAERPNGVVIYQKGNISDFLSKVLKELEKKKKVNSKTNDFENYNKILKIYLKLFNEEK